jgi:hypothetical protein
MKLREVQRLISLYVRPRFPELRLVDDLVVRWDGDPILRGFAVERLQMNPDMVRLHAFAQPLFVPADVVYLSVGTPLGDYVFDDGNEGEVMAQLLERAEREGRAILDRVSDCSSLAENVKDITEGRLDRDLSGEIRAYCLLWSGRPEEAADELDDVIERLREFEVESELGTLTQVTQVREALERSEEEARALLQAWAEQTAQALRLPA